MTSFVFRVCFTSFVVIPFIVHAQAVVAPCPAKCQCSMTNSGVHLDVRCGGRTHTDIDPAVLYTELDQLLTANIDSNLKALSVAYSPLTTVPPSLCQMTTLTTLELGHNQLRQLPDCLSNLTALTRFKAGHNNISELQDGVFDGLSRLTALYLEAAQIRSIGTNVFAHRANLISLQSIYLIDNFLTALEPWPFVIGLNGNYTSRVRIELGNNSISKFTNHMGLYLGCGMNTSYVELHLNVNPINHFQDMVTGWQIATVTDLACLLVIPPPGTPIVSSSVLLVLRKVKLICDCTDYLYFASTVLMKRAHIFQQVYCRLTPETPASVVGVEVTRVPLDMFVCHVVKDCPAACSCVYQPANAAMHINCSAANLTALPLLLPHLEKSYTTYKLHYSKNRFLHRLEPRGYFARTSVADVSNCNLDGMDIVSWKSLALVGKSVLLSGNSLSSLPQSVTSINLTVDSLALYDNPWKCSCENRWMAHWLNSIKASLASSDTILCATPPRLSGMNILGMSDDNFCIDPAEAAKKRALIISLTSFGGVMITLLSMTAIVYRLRVQLYSRWKFFHPFDRDECVGENMDYDVFFCCCSSDNDPHGLQILETLESHGYRVCYHLRDFLGGEAIVDNMVNAVMHSKRTICLITKDFLSSRPCMQEFDISYHHNIVGKGKRRLIALMALDDRRSLYADDASDKQLLRHFFEHYTYIDYKTTDDQWLDKLLYALPQRGLNM